MNLTTGVGREEKFPPAHRAEVGHKGITLEELASQGQAPPHLFSDLVPDFKFNERLLLWVPSSKKRSEQNGTILLFRGNFLPSISPQVFEATRGKMPVCLSSMTWDTLCLPIPPPPLSCLESRLSPKHGRLKRDPLQLLPPHASPPSAWLLTLAQPSPPNPRHPPLPLPKKLSLRFPWQRMGSHPEAKHRVHKDAPNCPYPRFPFCPTSFQEPPLSPGAGRQHDKPWPRNRGFSSVVCSKEIYILFSAQLLQETRSCWSGQSYTGGCCA